LNTNGFHVAMAMVFSTMEIIMDFKKHVEGHFLGEVFHYVLAHGYLCLCVCVSVCLCVCVMCVHVAYV